MKCPSCLHGELELMNENIPFDQDYYICRNCYSTYNPWNPIVRKLKLEEENEKQIKAN